MTKKDEFVKAFKEKTGKDAQEFHKSKDYKGFVALLDELPNLRSSFREAVDEAQAGSPEDKAVAGLNNLFDNL